jgi:hypothetical protein
MSLEMVPQEGAEMAIEVDQELLWRALDEPPQELVEMRRVYNGVAPTTESERWLKTWRDTKPAEFMRAYQQAQRDYRQEQIAKQASSAKDGKMPAAEVDEGEDRALELYREWVEDRRQGPKLGT